MAKKYNHLGATRPVRKCCPLCPGKRTYLPILELPPPPTLRERGHRGLARWLVAVHRMPAAGGGGGGFGGLGGGGLGGRGGKMATRKVKCVLVVVISVLFCPNLPRPARQRGRAWEAATTAAAAKGCGKQFVIMNPR